MTPHLLLVTIRNNLTLFIYLMKCHHMQRGGGDAVYGLGIIGAAIYYISTATTFWIGVLGILKAMVWPVFLVYELLKYLIG